MHAIGIDIGTTSICGVLIDAKDGRLLKSHTVAGDAFIRTDFAWEKLQDVDKIISVARELLYELADPDTAVIGLTGQMHGILYTDEQGQAVSPLYTWQDQRGNLPFGDTTYAEYLGSCPGYGGVTDFYNRMNGIRPAEAVCCCTIADYLGMKLCGLSQPVIHSSNLASFGNISGMENKAEVTGDYRIIGEWSLRSGAGCLILEIQEPTDFTIQPEHWCGDYKLNDMEMYQGVSREAALECFDYTQAPDTKMEPEIISESEDAIYENLIGPADTDCFVINRIRLTGGKHVMKLTDSYGVYIVTEGEGWIGGEDYRREVKKGDYFFLPCCAMGAFALNGNLECVECY